MNKTQNGKRKATTGSAGRRAVRPSVRIVTTSSDQKNGRRDSGKRLMPRRARLKMISLGGSGKMNKNMILYEYDDPNLPDGGDIIIVDMGMGFPESEMYGIDYLIPDITYLKGRLKKIRGVLITHGHEDHIGALPHLIPELGDVPVFATRITAGLIERKFSEYKEVKDKKVQVIDSEETLRLGVFRIEPFRVAHSVPEAVGYGIHTPYGLMMHVSDFRFDADPIDGWTTDSEKIKRICEQAGGALLLNLDSTRVEEKGRSISSRVVDEAFVQVFNEAKGRIIVTAFSSQLARIQQILWAAEKNGRKVAISGRSMENNVKVAISTKYLKVPEGVMIPVKDVKKYPDDRLVIIVTGGQGQKYSALVRMSVGEHRQIQLKNTDMIVVSSSPIPGNEEEVYRMMDDLIRSGARVVHHKEMDIYVGGHGFRDEIADMIKLVNPKYHVPAHGDLHMLVANKDVAVRDCGMSPDNVFIVEDGQVVEITENDVRVSSRRIPVGSVMVDGNGVGDIGNIVLRDRQAMASDGIFVVIVTINKKKIELASSPDIISRGFVYMRDSEKLIFGARAEIKRIFTNHANRDSFDQQNLKEELKQRIGDYLYKNTKRRPMVVPVVIEV